MICAISTAIVPGIAVAELEAGLRFDFVTDAARPDLLRVFAEPATVGDTAYGVDAAAGSESPGGVAAEQPFRFWVALPEGSYRCEVELGDDRGPSDAVIKAESRRLVVPRQRLEAAERRTVTFSVNIRTPILPDGGEVRLTPREIGSVTWDDRLTLEFLGDRPVINSLRVLPLTDAVTVYLAGDSTVVDGGHEPWSGWGQMLPVFFGPDVVVSNHAESGRSVRSFAAERRFEKILTTLGAGDYVFFQFGHNDMKEKGEGIGPYQSFQQGLRDFIAQTRARGAHPVLVTPMHRRWFNDDGTVRHTHGDYPDAMRQVAAELDVPLIDLQVSSRAFYESLGKEGSKRAFVHYPANTFPRQAERLKDDTHHNNYGAYVLARSVVEGIREQVPDLAGHLVGGFPVFDPADPPVPDEVDVPRSGSAAPDQTPAGS